MTGRSSFSGGFQPPLTAGLSGSILGVGVDLVDIRRIERAVDRFGPRFISRIYTSREQAVCESRPRTRVASYARRWAAKEACAKALGTGLSGGLSMGVQWREMEVERRPSGQPDIRLYGASLARAFDLAAEFGPPGSEPRIHVSMTDEPPYAHALVVLEAAVIGAPARDVAPKGAESWDDFDEDERPTPMRDAKPET